MSAEVQAPGRQERYCPCCATATQGTFSPGPGGRPDAACPQCVSLERQRFFALFLAAIRPVLGVLDLVLEVAPSPQTEGPLDRLQARRHLRVDFDPAADRRRVDVQASLTDLPFAGSSVDLLVCYHVLEHIPADRRAMREIARVLGRRGVGLIQVPWRPTVPTDEDPSAPPEERIRRFGQIDHVRYYGEDFEDRLRDAGLSYYRFTPETFLGPEAVRVFRLVAHEPVWVVRADGEDRAGAMDAASGLGDTFGFLLADREA